MNSGYNPFENCHYGRKAEVPVGDEDEYSRKFGFEDGEEMLNELNGLEGISDILQKNMQSELNAALHGPENILIVGTEGTRTVTIITAPQSTLKGKGPVLLPTSDKNRIVAMVSEEFIQKKAAICSNMEDEAGAQEKWESLLEYFFETVLDLADAGNGKNLEIPDFIPEEGF